MGAKATAVAGRCACVMLASLLALCGCSGESKEEQQHPPELRPTEIPPPLLQSIAERATSGDSNTVAEIMEVPPGEILDQRFVKQMESLTLKFDPRTAVSLGDRQVRIDARIIDAKGAVTRWYVVLDEVDGNYFIATTEEQS